MKRYRYRRPRRRSQPPADQPSLFGPQDFLNKPNPEPEPQPRPPRRPQRIEPPRKFRAQWRIDDK